MSFPPYTTTYHTTTYPAISPLLISNSAANRTIFITGGGTGLGPNIARSFAAAGSKQLVLLGRTSSSLIATKTSIEAEFPQTKVLTFVADITDADAVDFAFAGTMKQFGRVDVLVMNAAYMPNAEKIVDADLEDYMRGFDINVKGPLILTRAFLRAQPSLPSINSSKDNYEPVIINVTTAGAHIPAAPGLSAYAASKLAGLKAMEYVGVENPGVRIMNVHPGVIDTDMNKKAVKAGFSLPFDDVSLPSHFLVWAASPQANFLRNKLIWANWDVDELKAKAEELQGSNQLTIGLLAWP